MGRRDQRVDAYIAKSAEFARPILTELRAIVHEGCPDTEEAIKWSMPFFMYKGGMLCSMASFKQHCAFGFWKGGAQVLGEDKSDDAMGQLGRITSAKDLPSRKTMVGYVKKAVAFADAPKAVPAQPKPRKPAKELAVPDYFMKAVKKNKKALATFEKFAPSHRNEYVEWVTEAKTDETRDRRLATTVEWLAEGKSRNWKYEKC
jgi:uncharacterized protein YdeI (YjbR/CyaY-like superfamily)